jgi:hypothetical protein
MRESRSFIRPTGQFTARNPRQIQVARRNVAGFEIEPYDHSLALTIDPVLKYSSLISGGAAIR